MNRAQSVAHWSGIPSLSQLLLAALLRLAEYLDRSRTRNVVRLQVVEDGRRKLRLRARARRGADARVEIWEAQRNADLFEAAFQCKLEITQE